MGRDTHSLALQRVESFSDARKHIYKSERVGSPCPETSRVWYEKGTNKPIPDESQDEMPVFREGVGFEELNSNQTVSYRTGLRFCRHIGKTFIPIQDGGKIFVDVFQLYLNFAPKVSGKRCHLLLVYCQARARVHKKLVFIPKLTKVNPHRIGKRCIENGADGCVRCSESLQSKTVMKDDF